MEEPTWIDERLALAIHARQIAEHGGDSGVRDTGLLSSALARPRNLFAYNPDAADLAALAAAYLIGICKNHPFIDGNKRVAAIVCETFVNLNDTQLDATDGDFYEVTMRVAKGEIDEEAVCAWVRRRIQQHHRQPT